MSDWHVQEVLNEVEARRRNEWIVETSDSYGSHEASDEYVCECSDAGCTTLLRLTRDEYESVRKNGAQFAIAVNHENPEVDRVTGENDRFAVVEKWLGKYRRIADETDPRSN